MSFERDLYLVRAYRLARLCRRNQETNNIVHSCRPDIRMRMVKVTEYRMVVDLEGNIGPRANSKMHVSLLYHRKRRMDEQHDLLA